MLHQCLTCVHQSNPPIDPIEHPHPERAVPAQPRSQAPKPATATAATTDDAPAAPPRDKPARTKKEALKKRESRGGVDGGSSRATPDPKLGQAAAAALDSNTCSPLRYKLALPRPADFEQPKGAVFTPHHEIVGPDGKEIQFHETSDHVYNKKNFHYTHCRADAGFPSSFYYRQTEPAPQGPHMSFEDASTHMYFDKLGNHITTDKGSAWRDPTSPSAKAGGEPAAANGHVRVGFSRREASLDAPVGFDAYSYGIRDKEGHKVHMSRPKSFFPAGEEICEGDVIGLEIKLPSEQLQRKILAGDYNPAVDNADEEPDPMAPAPNIVRDRIPIRFKSHIYFEKIDYHTTKDLEDLMNPSPAVSGPAAPPNPHHPVPALRTLPVLLVPPPGYDGAEEDEVDMVDLGDREDAPAAAKKTELRPKLSKLRPVVQRYVEQVVEDVICDVVDEVDFWLQDGGSKNVVPKAGEEKEASGTAVVPAQEEIKELVQDD
ncbi:unnamed protein product [Parascedosporium putredinis]|uniref:SPRY domain-containing protein n=1 Tax=Parascedosporium putredinis TaxID=1442378 RepID=A0A9P1M7I8_9PEZI|nr:unnamed protein product [Parascedosporium putredinis]CAI7987748.1 unnamed protein product [Parascedosporium putredinis]